MSEHKNPVLRGDPMFMIHPAWMDKDDEFSRKLKRMVERGQAIVVPTLPTEESWQNPEFRNALECVNKCSNSK